MRGYIVDRRFKTRSWGSVPMKLPLSGGATLTTTRYVSKVPRAPKTHLPYQEIPGLSQKYRVSTMTRVIIPNCNPLITSYPGLPYHKFSTAMVNGPSQNSRSGKERAQCLEPTCLKFFADRSSLNRHKRRMHPELVNPGSKLATNN